MTNMDRNSCDFIHYLCRNVSMLLQAFCKESNCDLVTLSSLLYIYQNNKLQGKSLSTTFQETSNITSQDTSVRLSRTGLKSKNTKKTSSLYEKVQWKTCWEQQSLKKSCIQTLSFLLLSSFLTVEGKRKILRDFRNIPRIRCMMHNKMLREEMQEEMQKLTMGKQLINTVVFSDQRRRLTQTKTLYCSIVLRHIRNTHGQEDVMK